MLGLMKRGQSWRNLIGQRIGARCSELGKFSNVCLDSSRCPFVSEIRMFLSSTGEIYDLLEGKVRKSFLHLSFLKFLQLVIINMPRGHILG